MNCAYQYPQPAHPQSVVMTQMSQSNHLSSTDTEYLEVNLYTKYISILKTNKLINKA